jgi:hypothetical protein
MNLVERLRDADRRGVAPPQNWTTACADRIEALEAEAAALRTVMIAAAEEIHAHWEAHCDAEGYGPQNLMRRLEEGIPSEYGYTAGAFEALRAEVAALKADAERYRLLRRYRVDSYIAAGQLSALDNALDAAIQQHAAGG